MRYQDYENDSAKDSNSSVYEPAKANRRRQQINEDYEFLERYDFITHLESAGLLRNYKDTSCKKESTEDIQLDLEFMEDPSFCHEVEYFNQLNKTLEKELVELDNKLSTPPPSRKGKMLHRSKTWKRKLSVALCGFLFTALLLGGVYYFSDILHENEDAYARDKEGDTIGRLNPTVHSNQIAEVKSEGLGNKQSSPALNDGSGKDTSQVNNQKDTSTKGLQEKNTAKEDRAVSFEDSAFIGNSLVVGLKQTCHMPKASFYACQSLDIGDAFDKAFVYDKKTGGKLTILQALGKKQFKKIYLMFGINELGWPYSNVFIKKYESLIQQIKKLQPNAVIYVQSILPVTKSCSQEKPVFSKENVISRNKLLKKMSKTLKVQFLDVYSYLKNKEGYLPENNSTDGIHLKKVGYGKWLEYLMKE